MILIFMAFGLLAILITAFLSFINAIQFRIVFADGIKSKTIRCGGAFPLAHNTNDMTYFSIPFIKLIYNDGFLYIRYPDYEMRIIYDQMIEVIQYKNKIIFTIKEEQIDKFEIFSLKAEEIYRDVENYRMSKIPREKNYCCKCNKITENEINCQYCGRALTYID